MNSNTTTPIWWTGLLGSLLMGVAGCGGDNEGPPRATAQGTVRLDGKPLGEGVIRFVPTRETKGPKTTLPIRDGHFEAPAWAGPLVGQHRVEIESTDDGGFALDDEQAIVQLRKYGHGVMDTVIVPEIYNERTRLTAEIVEDGPNEIEFTLVTPLRHRRTR
ncbi:MAG: hypothetical protein KDA93_09310 [Planctomycetaceae bacterium]|nr:hypothetical protein [Planctomycetaceae bacterium]